MPSWQVIQSDQLIVLKHLMKLPCLVVLADMNIRYYSTTSNMEKGV